MGHGGTVCVRVGRGGCQRTCCELGYPVLTLWSPGGEVGPMSHSLSSKGGDAPGQDEWVGLGFKGQAKGWGYRV